MEAEVAAKQLHIAEKQLQMEKELEVSKVRLQAPEEDESVGPNASELDHLMDEEDVNSTVQNYLDSILKDPQPAVIRITTSDVATVPTPPMYSTPVAGAINDFELPRRSFRPQQPDTAPVKAVKTPIVSHCQYEPPLLDPKFQTGVHVNTSPVAVTHQLNPNATHFVPVYTQQQQAS